MSTSLYTQLDPIPNHLYAPHDGGQISRLLHGSNIGYFLVGAFPFASNLSGTEALMSISSFIFVRNAAIAVANHRFPPSWNQLRWPPQLVVQRTVYGFCLNSSYGMASLHDIWKI